MTVLSDDTGVKGDHGMVRNNDKSVRYSIAFLKLAIGGVLLLIAVICAMILYELVLNPVDRQKAVFFYPVFQN